MTTFLNTLKIIHIHPILIIFIVISIITGTFIHLFILLSLVLIHELGHFLAAKYYKWRIQTIVLWVFGGVMKTDESGNRSIKEDIVVTIAGPLQHVWIHVLLVSLLKIDIFPPSILQTAIDYNWMIFFFNLLPIYPLDGGKIFFYTLSVFLPFRQAHRTTILFSIYAASSIILFQLFFLPFTLSALLIIVFLLFENRSEWKNHYYLFMRFLLYRFHYPVHVKIEKLMMSETDRLIDAFSLFRRNRTHYIYIKNEMNHRHLKEQNSLYLYFKENKLNESIGEIMKEK